MGYNLYMVSFIDSVNTEAEEMREETKVQIQIGRFEREYTLVETNAPKAYDGHGTFTLKDSMDDPRYGIRVILVEVGHAKWQEGRNHSGLFTFEFLGGLDGWVRETLYKKITADLEVK